MSPAERNYTANEQALLGMIRILETLRCYSEGSQFKIFTDNQVLNYLFTKSNLRRSEPRWIGTLGIFGIIQITLKPGKIHVLDDILSRAPHAKVSA